MTTEREAQTVTGILDAWASTFRVIAADYDQQALAAEDAYLEGFAAAYREAAQSLQSASVGIKYRRRDAHTLRPVK